MTYSLGITGAPAGQAQSVETLTLPDGFCRPGEMALAMQTGQPMLCRGRDGSFGWYTLDAERSTPDIPVLKALY